MCTQAPDILRNWSPWHPGHDYTTATDASRYLLSINVLLAYIRFLNVLTLHPQIGKLIM